MDDLRNNCLMRHENGNCTVIGGFCTAVNDPICEGLHSAYDSGYRAAALRTKQEREHPMTNADRIRAMSDEEMANWLARTQYANMMEDAEIFGTKLPFKEETLKGSEKEWFEWLQQPSE